MAKDEFQVCIPNEINTKLGNNRKGFQKLLKLLKPEDILGTESTSNYHHPLAIFFIKKGYKVMEINPIVTNQQIRATVRKKKTDKTDAELISQSIRDGNGHAMTEKALDNSLKKLIRGRKYLVHMRSNIKKKLKSYDKDVCDVKDLQKILTEKR